MTTPPQAPASEVLPDAVRSPVLDRVTHGFFTRRGGVSTGPYASLNCSTGGADDPGHVATNRARVARSLGAEPDRLVGLTQVHGTVVATATSPWRAGQGARADAMVTAVPGLVLGIVTADCAPVLLHDEAAGVVGAAHAGWRGAASGVLEATVSAMVGLGAVPARILAAIGPCIAQPSYEVGPDMRDSVIASAPDAGAFFVPAARAGHFLFDLAGFCADRLLRTGVGAAVVVGIDTRQDIDGFFSHRRRTLAGGGPIGHQISAIRL